MNKERYLFVVSGPSGSGKDTVVGELQKKHPEIETTISATSRSPRGKERNGVEYFFMSREAFEEKLKNNQILEYTDYCGNYYGTLRSEIEDRMEKGIITFLVIDVVGAQNMKKTYPECTTVFIQPPSYEELSRRLYKRQTEDEETIQKRLQRAKEEMEFAKSYDYAVVNGELADCVEEIYQIIQKRQK